MKAPMTLAAIEAEFAAYFERNYPGPDTIISNPRWHAPKIFRAATFRLTDGGTCVPEALWTDRGFLEAVAERYGETSTMPHAADDAEWEGFVGEWALVLAAIRDELRERAT